MKLLDKAKNAWAVLVACGLAFAIAGCAPATASTSSAQETTSTVSTSSTQETTSQAAATSATRTSDVTLDGWAKDSPALAALVDFVSASTDESSTSYIPPEDRIAVFDMDGTLMGERFPTYFIDWLCVWRALYDETYEAPADIKARAEGWERDVLKGEEMSEADRRLSTTLFAGLTVDEFKDVVRAFKAQPVWGFKGMTYGQSVFKPMASVVEYLADNGYTVYVCSGTWRDAVRVMCEGTLDEWIDDSHVIGTDLFLEASGQGATAGEDYTMGTDEELLVVGGDYDDKNLKTNKVISIEREIGKHPVLAFGNSGGDMAMGNYTLDNPHYQGAAFMLLCDNTELDYGDLGVATDFSAKCEAAGFTTVSMAHDWTTIYGEGVVKAPVAEGDELSAAA